MAEATTAYSGRPRVPIVFSQTIVEALIPCHATVQPTQPKKKPNFFDTVVSLAGVSNLCGLAHKLAWHQDAIARARLKQAQVFDWKTA
jgi:hypothetical protein